MRGHEKIKEQLLDELGGLGRNSKQKERNPISWGGIARGVTRNRGINGRVSRLVRRT